MPRGIRPIQIESGVGYVTLTKGKVALVDACVVPLIDKWNWSAQWNPNTRSYYAVRGGQRVDGKRSPILMHRQILGLHPGNPQQGDHALHNTLDNRRFVNGRKNLRLATHAQNMMNRGIQSNNQSGQKGVTAWPRCPNKPWRAMIGKNGKGRTIGYFATKELASEAVKGAAQQEHGEFACDWLSTPEERRTILNDRG